MAIEGGCLCRAVRFTIDGKLLGTRLCWCRECQYRAAGNASVNVIFKSDAISTAGDIRWYESKADSGNDMRRGFCPKCGTQLFSSSSGSSHLTVVRVGALDDPSIGAPEAIIWTKSAPAWATLDPALPHFPKGPPAAPTSK